MKGIYRIAQTVRGEKALRALCADLECHGLEPLIDCDHEPGWYWVTVEGEPQFPPAKKPKGPKWPRLSSNGEIPTRERAIDLGIKPLEPSGWFSFDAVFLAEWDARKANYQPPQENT